MNTQSNRYTVTPIKRGMPGLAMALSLGLWAVIITVVLVLAGCDSEGPAQNTQTESQRSPFAEEKALNTDRVDNQAAPAADSATQPAAGVEVKMSPASGSDASGSIVLTEVQGGDLNMEITMSGLAPGNHGFHVHEKGNCSARDASSAGGHFSPEDMPHGAPSDEKQHAGDLGNLEADQLGHARASMTTDQLSLDGPDGVRGRAFIVHRDADDLDSQPSGAAGARVACGVVPTG